MVVKEDNGLWYVVTDEGYVADVSIKFQQITFFYPVYVGTLARFRQQEDCRIIVCSSSNEYPAPHENVIGLFTDDMNEMNQYDMVAGMRPIAMIYDIILSEVLRSKIIKDIFPHVGHIWDKGYCLLDMS